MPTYFSGTVVRTFWEVMDLPGTGTVTGLLVPGDVTLALFRDTGSAWVAASEALTWTEIGATGRYYITYTPQNSGRYVLILNELSALSMQRKGVRFDHDIAAAGAFFSPNYGDAFCAETDVERWLQKAIDTTTNPDDVDTAAFAVNRAAVLMSLCAGLGYPVTPLTVPAGSTLKTMLRDANAIGAALDYTAAEILGQAPSKSERFEYFRQLWISYVGGQQPGSAVNVVGTIAMEIKANLASLGTDHILSGDTLAAAATQPTDIGIEVTMGDVF